MANGEADVVHSIVSSLIFLSCLYILIFNVFVDESGLSSWPMSWWSSTRADEISGSSLTSGSDTSSSFILEATDEL